MLKDKLQTLQTEFTKLKDKILTKLSTHQETITQSTQQLQAANKQVEIHSKENHDNETVLDKLLSDFQELSRSLEN